MPLPRITIPTYFTLSRFVLVPIFAYLFLHEAYALAVIVLGIAGLTDFLDGYIARRFNMRSRLGAMLDPLADKFLMLISFVILSREGIIPWPLTFLIISRDFCIVMGTGILSVICKIKIYYRPTRLSKTTTFSQILVLVLSFLEVFLKSGTSSISEALLTLVHFGQIICVIVAVILTITTYFQYVYIGYKFYRYGERQSH